MRGRRCQRACGMVQLTQNRPFHPRHRHLPLEGARAPGVRIPKLERRFFDERLEATPDMLRHSSVCSGCPTI